MLLATTGREVEYRVRMGGVTQVEPGIGGPPGLQEFGRTLIDVNDERVLEPLDHHPVDRLQQRRARGHQIAQSGAGHRPTLPREDRLLAVERQVVNALRHDHLGE
jgi:hypothetical protein